MTVTLSPESERLARLLAEGTGRTLEQVLEAAVLACARERGILLLQDHKPSAERMMEISERFSAYPILDPRPADEIIGYNEIGVPD